MLAEKYFIRGMNKKQWRYRVGNSRELNPFLSLPISYDDLPAPSYFSFLSSSFGATRGETDQKFSMLSFLSWTNLRGSVFLVL